MILQFNDRPIKFGGKQLVFTPSSYPSAASFVPYDVSTFADIEHKTRDKFKEFNADDINGNDSTADQIIFILRHSEREKTDKDTSGKDGVPDGVIGGLTQKGYEYAETAGRWLKTQNNSKWSLSDCGFFCTSSERTLQTVQAFAKGLFGLEQLPEHYEIGVKNGEAAYKLDFDPEGKSFSYSWPACSTYADTAETTHWTQGEDFPSLTLTQFDLKAREIISNVIGLAGDKKFTLCVSHDFNTLPLVSWACSQSIQWNFTGKDNDRWLCYLAGVAIVINKTTNKCYVKLVAGIENTNGIMTQGYDNILNK